MGSKITLPPPLRCYAIVQAPDEHFQKIFENMDDLLCCADVTPPLVLLRVGSLWLPLYTALCNCAAELAVSDRDRLSSQSVLTVAEWLTLGSWRLEWLV